MNDFKNFLGILIFPIVALLFIVISPILLLIMYINYRKEDGVQK